MVQLPAAVKRTVLPLSVQTLGVGELKTTGFPEAPPVALTSYVPFTSAGLGGWLVKVIAWVACVTVTVAVYSAESPSWSITLPRTICAPGAPAVQLEYALGVIGE